MAGEAGPVAARALHAHELDLTEATQPPQRMPVTAGAGLEALDTQQRAALVERRHDVNVEMGVDTRGDAKWQGGHRHPSVGKRVGGTTPAGSDGQDSDGPLRQAPSRSLRPTGGCRVSARTRPTDRYQDSPRERQPALVESDLVGAPTRTLTAPTTKMVDPTNARRDPRCRQ
jgi:hypothetical protein